MSPEKPELEREVAAQRRVTRVALAAVDGFALAGSGAIREHGIVDRPTEDVDLFTTSQDVAAFGAAVQAVIAQLRASGIRVEQTRQAPQYARLHVVTGDGQEFDVDMGVDWRQADPVRFDVGPVLSLSDAIGSKMGALYSRGEVRDFLDVDAIRASGRSSDDELLGAAPERDPGFEVGMFVRRLEEARRFTLDEVARYGVTAEQLAAVKARCLEWASTLRRQMAGDIAGAPAPGLSDE